MSEERVRIVREDHPHYGEVGVFTGEVIEFNEFDGQMAKVKLDACVHGVEACYVNPGDITRVKNSFR